MAGSGYRSWGALWRLPTSWCVGRCLKALSLGLSLAFPGARRQLARIPRPHRDNVDSPRLQRDDLTGSAGGGCGKSESATLAIAFATLSHSSGGQSFRSSVIRLRDRTLSRLLIARQICALMAATAEAAVAMELARTMLSTFITAWFRTFLCWMRSSSAAVPGELVAQSSHG